MQTFRINPKEIESIAVIPGYSLFQNCFEQELDRYIYIYIYDCVHLIPLYLHSTLTLTLPPSLSFFRFLPVVFYRFFSPSLVTNFKRTYLSCNSLATTLLTGWWSLEQCSKLDPANYNSTIRTRDSCSGLLGLSHWIRFTCISAQIQIQLIGDGVRFCIK